MGDGNASTGWEAVLRSRLVARDEGAIADAYDQYAPTVMGLAFRVTQSEQAAEEICQEVFLALWERPEAFDPAMGTLRSWLGMLTHRRAVDWVRREVARRQRQVRNAAMAMVPSPDIEEEVMALGLAERVRGAVDALPEDQRAAIRLAYYEGQTYRQVAGSLGIPEGTAKSRLRAALHRIADAVEADVLERWS